MRHKFYIFRNYTVEHLFANLQASFSGYNDISIIDESADIYIWFYTQPINIIQNSVASEVDQIIKYLEFVLNRLPAGKTVLVFTMTRLTYWETVDSDSSLTEAINNYNNTILSISREKGNVKIVNFDEFQLICGSKIVDWKYFLISQIIVNPKLSLKFDQWFKDKIASVLLQRKKCLILDLDNTLWGGVLGEDGPEGIKLGNSYPGNVFLYFQKFVLELKKTGIILAICSKNNYSDLIELWSINKNLVVKLDDFTIIKANWDDKSKNIESIADELNIGLDSLVFVDDNPRERQLIKMALPEVSVPEFPMEPFGLLEFMANELSRLFRTYTLTIEDIQKSKQYDVIRKREQSKNNFVSFNDYLSSLEIRIRIMPVGKSNLSRVAQMTQKTNQFNLTTLRFSEAEILELLSDEYFLRVFSVSDKFGDDGITGLIIIRMSNDKISATIENFLLSCRILGKGIEFAVLSWICNKLKSLKIQKVFAKFAGTKKNIQVSNFYEKYGFQLETESENEKTYHLELRSEYSIENFYSIIEEGN